MQSFISNEFGWEKWDDGHCMQCGKGKFISKVFKHKSFQKLEAQFINTCESAKNEYCHHVKGWEFRPFDIITVLSLSLRIYKIGRASCRERV